MTCPFKDRPEFRQYVLVPASPETQVTAYFGNLKDARDFQISKPAYFHYELYRRLKPISEKQRARYKAAKARKELRLFKQRLKARRKAEG